MKKNLIRTAVMLAIVLIAGKLSAQTKIDLSGKWLLDTAKSEFNRLPAMVASQKVTVEQKSNELVIIAENGKSKNTYRNTLGAGESRMVSSSGSTIVSKIETDEKGLKRSLDVSTVEDPETLMYSRKEIWSLSADGKVLTIKQLVQPASGNGDYSFTAVYNKIVD